MATKSIVQAYRNSDEALDVVKEKLKFWPLAFSLLPSAFSGCQYNLSTRGSYVLSRVSLTTIAASAASLRFASLYDYCKCSNRMCRRNSKKPKLIWCPIKRNKQCPEKLHAAHLSSSAASQETMRMVFGEDANDEMFSPRKCSSLTIKYGRVVTPPPLALLPSILHSSTGCLSVGL